MRSKILIVKTRLCGFVLFLEQIYFISFAQVYWQFQCPGSVLGCEIELVVLILTKWLLLLPTSLAQAGFLCSSPSSESKTLALIISFLFQQIEVCLSKEVTHVISDNPDIPSILSPALPIGPPSPWTPSQTPSPATSTSAIDSTDRRKCHTAPNSRAEAILAKARTPVGDSGSVLEKARRLGIKNIWSLSKTIQWLLKYKTKYGFNKSGSNRDREKSKSEKKQLVHPAIKLEEESNNSRPIFAELKSWPVLRFDGKPGSSPFSLPSNSKQKTKKFARRIGIEPEENKKKVEKKDVKKSRKSNKKTDGFCEICNSHFPEFEKHLESQQHREFVDNSKNWTLIDKFSSSLAELQPFELLSENFNQEPSSVGTVENVVSQDLFKSESVGQESLRTPSQRD